MPFAGCEQGGPLREPVAIYEGKVPKHGMLCASFSDSSGELSVRETVAGGPASEAGILVGDEILEINRSKFETVDQVLSFLSSTKPGDDLVVLIRRSGMEIEFNVTLCDFKTFTKLKATDGRPRGGDQNFNDGDKTEQ